MKLFARGAAMALALLCLVAPLAAPIPAQAQLAPIVSSAVTAPVSVATATTTQLIPLAANQVTYVTFAHVEAAGTGNITFVYGTGSNCATAQTALSGAIALTAQAGFAAGSGIGPVMVVPRGNALCLTTSAAVQMSGWLTYAQF